MESLIIKKRRKKNEQSVWNTWKSKSKSKKKLHLNCVLSIFQCLPPHICKTVYAVAAFLWFYSVRTRKSWCNYTFFQTLLFFAVIVSDAVEHPLLNRIYCYIYMCNMEIVFCSQTQKTNVQMFRCNCIWQNWKCKLKSK